MGRPQKRRFPGKYEPVEIRSLATELDEAVWRLIALRPGEKSPRTSRFAAVRVRATRRAHVGWPPGPERWLLVEWPEGDSCPSHYFLSSMPAETPLEELARTAKHRWRVERDYQDAKQEVGLDQYEGRRWTGLNHHLTICMAAMTYLVASRALFPLTAKPSLAEVRRQLQDHLRSLLGHCPLCRRADPTRHSPPHRRAGLGRGPPGPRQSNGGVIK